MSESKIAMNSLTWVIGGAQGSSMICAPNIFSGRVQRVAFTYSEKREYSNIEGEATILQ